MAAHGVTVQANTQRERERERTIEEKYASR